MLNPSDIAEMFNRSVSWVYQNYNKLSRIKNFPKPQRINGYNIQWNSEEVETWFQLNIQNKYVSNDNTAASYDKLLAANAALL